MNQGGTGKWRTGVCQVAEEEADEEERIQDGPIKIDTPSATF